MAGLASPQIVRHDREVFLGAIDGLLALTGQFGLLLDHLDPAGAEVVALAVPAEFAGDVVSQGDGAQGDGAHEEVVGPDALSGIGQLVVDQIHHLFPGPVLSGQFLAQLVEDGLVQVDDGRQVLTGHEVAALAVHIAHAAQGGVQLGLSFFIVLDVLGDVQHVGVGQEGIQVQPEVHVGQVALSGHVGQLSGAVSGSGLEHGDLDVGVLLHELVDQGLGQLEIVPGHEGQLDGIGGVHLGHVVRFRRREGAQGQRHAQSQHQGQELLHGYSSLLFNHKP